MVSVRAPSLVDRWARTPFYFNSAAHLLRIGRERATNLNELLAALRACPNDSIFEHTFQTLQEHHFIREGFSNDFCALGLCCLQRSRTGGKAGRH